ncbi:hypothetical protein DFH07DRAFT_791143 [Mycena maculata]|uniref:F-box domain-containing protein n=1 Tax=Mycena maculata TaxID=230809 RepID=A0AAD7P0G0_9AGAR|nr:hypothetical protein DFH07DRAFT_791143 [Mycena maculata]
MSVAELQKWLKEISSSITQQKRLHKQRLRDLEQSRSDVRRQLNELRDPLARLPLEVSSEIFMQSLPPLGWIVPSPYRPPMLLLNVCNSWSDIALATPALWTNVDVLFPRAEGFEALLDRWFDRAKSRPLSIALGVEEGDLDEEIQLVVNEHAHRVETLEINADSASSISDLKNPFPLLKTFHIRGFQSIDLAVWLDILRLAPNLHECIFPYPTYFHGRMKPEGLTLAHLHHLRLGEYMPLTVYCQGSCPFPYLTLPSLRTLAISSKIDIDPNELSEFILRTRPPLKSLSISPKFTDLSAQTLNEFFRPLRIIELADLELVSDSVPETTAILELLASGPQTILPTLRTLTISGLCPERIWYTTLLDTLRQCAHINEFRLHGDRYADDTYTVDDDIVSALRELPTKIHVGRKGDRSLV